jgi:hypothetical protein
MQIDHITKVLSLQNLVNNINTRRYNTLRKWRSRIESLAELNTLANIGWQYYATGEMAELAVTRTVCADFFLYRTH